MTRYVLERFLSAFFVILGVATIVFFLMRLTPGDPAVLIGGPTASQEDLARIRDKYGLDEPILVQYVRWLGQIARGDFGRSITMYRPVLDEVLSRFSATAILATSSLALATLLGIPLGVLSAVKHNSVLDQITVLLTTLGISTPAFWLGILLIVLFTLSFPVIPGTGMHSARGEGGLVDLLRHLILPALTLAAAPLAVITRMTRSAMLDVLVEGYVVVARAKGLRELRVVLGHALANAAVPVVTIVGMEVGYLLGGSVLVETVFSWPGIGRMLVIGVLSRDFPLVQGGVIVVATSFVLVNLLVDIAYCYLDPRISYA
jgi:peptide/nickel transport system permease protein